MRDLRNRWTGVAALFLALLAAETACAADYTIGSLRISNPWTRVTPKGARVAGGYMTITNNGTTPDRLVGGTAAVAGRFEVHDTAMEKGVAKMRPIIGGVVIQPGETIELKPGSMHVMLMELKQPLEQGRKVKGTIEFEKAGKVEIEYAVEPLGAASPRGGKHDTHKH